MYKRKVETYFQNWKKSENRKPLVIKGVRQCGKTSSVLKFAKEHYKEVIYIDFHQQPQLKSIFNGSLDINYLTVAISAAIPSAIFEIQHMSYIRRNTRLCKSKVVAQIFQT